MKGHKLLKKLQHLLDADYREQAVRRDSLKKVLKKLRKRRDALKEALEKTDDEKERRLIREQMEIIKVQRKKGLTLLSDLRHAKD